MVIFCFKGVNLKLCENLIQAVMSEARSQQAVSMTELNWLGRRFSVDNAKTRSCIVKGALVNHSF